MTDQTPQIGDDVSALMGGAAPAPSAAAAPPPIGADVSHLMAPQMNTAMVNGQRVPVDDEPINRAANVAGAVSPTVGGIVGGVLGGVPGAALGGAVGQGWGQLIQHARELPGAIKDVAQGLSEHPDETWAGAKAGALSGLKDAGIEAAKMAAGEGIGQFGVKALAGVGRTLMNEAAGAPMSLAREFPELSGTMIEHALTVTKGGLAKARDLLHAAKATANAALDTAASNGATVPITAATDGLQKTFNEVAVNSSDPVGALSKLAALERKIGIGRAQSLTMREADALKTSLQNEASTLYKAIKAGNGSKSLALEMVAKADMAQSLNQAIEDIATKAGAAGYKAANSSAQELIGATRAISRRLLQHGGSPGRTVVDLATPMVGGAMVGGLPGAATAGAGTAMLKAAVTPSNLSRVAVAANHPAVQAFLRQLPLPVLSSLASYIWPATSGSSK